MSRRLPPLNSLRAFEAAGRNLSITRAAEELAVTQAAVSHQVKVLEDALGVPLFRRLPRQLRLTAAGETLLPVISESLDGIAATIAAIRENTVVEQLTIRLAPSFAAKWLSPRLESFRREQPGIDLVFRHSNKPPDFRRADLDLAVTYGRGEWSGVTAERILSLDFFPVCAPGYPQAGYPLDDVDNLRHYTLLHDASYDTWTAWLKMAGATQVDPRHGTILDDTNVLIQAAMDGQGIALGSGIFVSDYIESGRLIRPFDLALENDYAYFVVCPPAHLERPAVRAFRDWILAERG